MSLRQTLWQNTLRYADEVSAQLESNFSYRMQTRETHVRNLADTFARMPGDLLTEELLNRKAEFLEMEDLFVLKAIGAEHIRFHDLRRTFATLSLKNGVDVKTLSSTLGHYSAGFTLSTYTDATADMKRDAADTIGSVISRAM